MIADALRSAGGAITLRPDGSRFASLRKVKVQRKLKGKQTSLVIDVRPDSDDSRTFIVRPGDVIMVPMVM